MNYKEFSSAELKNAKFINHDANFNECIEQIDEEAEFDNYLFFTVQEKKDFLNKIISLINDKSKRFYISNSSVVKLVNDSDFNFSIFTRIISILNYKIEEFKDEIVEILCTDIIPFYKKSFQKVEIFSRRLMFEIIFSHLEKLIVSIPKCANYLIDGDDSILNISISILYRGNEICDTILCSSQEQTELENFKSTLMITLPFLSKLLLYLNQYHDKIAYDLLFLFYQHLITLSGLFQCNEDNKRNLKDEKKIILLIFDSIYSISVSSIKSLSKFVLSEYFDSFKFVYLKFCTKKSIPIMLKIIHSLLKYDFHQHYQQFYDCGIQDIILYYLKNTDELELDQLQMVFLILQNTNPSTFDKMVILNLKNHLEETIEKRTMICFSLSEIILHISQTSHTYFLKTIIEEFEILPVFIDFLNIIPVNQINGLVKSIIILFQFGLSNDMKDIIKEQLEFYNIETLEKELYYIGLENTEIQKILNLLNYCFL